jgi:RimJ/RimL family protein N-acetyltransferase
MGPETFPQTISLRDGNLVALQPLKPGDMDTLQAFYGALPEEERMVLKDDVTTPEWAQRFKQKLESGEVISLVAMDGREIVGEGTLYRTYQGWTRHVGEIRIACHRDYRRKSLGTCLASALVKIATDLGIEKIIVQVVENQLGARKTFEKLGFHKDAVLPHHVMDLSGIKRDLIVMANDVSQIWAAMEAINQDVPLHMGD